MHARTLATAVLVLAWTASGALAQSPTLISQQKDWAAYSYAGSKGKVCYALSKPKKLEPGDRNHGDVFFFISNRPGEGVNNEPSLIVGYPFRDGSKVDVNIDGKAYSMFTKGDGAWVENAAQEASLVAAMKAGSSMTVSGVSSRGTNTSYTFSLSGITASVNIVDKECK
ncbi:MAG: hypothetical protein C0606_08820 [Hyphomicrobiales bacterium]|nr:MAG: hypothetical protein C0606_08820 [Hyphomicrobiales bacterium]